jgi:hypothetical protein
MPEKTVSPPFTTARYIVVYLSCQTRMIVVSTRIAAYYYPESQILISITYRATRITILEEYDRSDHEHANKFAVWS